jgi:asparagine synthase (glutamine-hydrolysing)
MTSYVCGHPQLNGADIDFAGLETTPSASDVNRWSGQFAVIVIVGDAATLVTDQIRSFPIFFLRAGAVLAVGDDHAGILGENRLLDQSEAQLFRHAGFVSGTRTLFVGMQQVRAGEVVTVNAADGVVAGETYRVFRYSRTPHRNTDSVTASFDSALSAGMDRLIARADGRQLVIPLSGGLDSRLISAYLKSARYENVVNFTYGRPESREVDVSKRVAEALGQGWHFIPYRPLEIAAAWAGEDAARFIAFSHSASAVPHIQDWYALSILKRDGLLDEDAIVLPGHTMVGNIHDAAVLDDPEPMDADRLKETLIDYHYGLQGRSTEMRDNPAINAELDEFLDQLGYDGTVLARAEAMEYFNLSERQAKYINNSMRAYEFFGYEWALPMLDTEMYLMWQTLDIKFTRDRSWYRQYVDGWFSRAANVDVDYFAPMTMSAHKRNTVKSALSRVRLEGAAQRLLTMRAVLRHHMSFNRFVGSMSQTELGWRTLRGQTLLGIYADLFLRDEWNPYSRVFH